MDLKQIEIELKKVSTNAPYKRKSEESDRVATRFIYKVQKFDELQRKIEQFNQQDLRDYATSRWFNHWNTKAVQYIFANSGKVVPNQNEYGNLIDFSINNKVFESKVSIFPLKFGKSIEYAVENKKELLEWLYKNQPNQRDQSKNTLFVMVHDTLSKEHWKVKAELSLIKTEVENYFANYSEENLVELSINGTEIYSDIIFIINK